MFLPSTEPAVPLPTPRLKSISTGISLLPPLSRNGRGPGLIVLCPETPDSLAIVDGVPWPLVKWAEEGYAVVEIQPQATTEMIAAFQSAIAALADCDDCTPKSKVGLVVYGMPLWKSIARTLSAVKEVVGAIVYADATEQPLLEPSPVPVLQHLSGASPSGRALDRADGQVRYWYPGTKSYRFAVPFEDDFHYATEAISHTRNLTFLKPLIGGPYFDLEVIWDEHTFYEFEDRSVKHTMSTMVQEPYVNHTPTLTGGIGRSKLTDFYRHHFIFSNSADTELELISRTVGIDRVVDEFIFKFTHDTVVDWMIPGIPPTHKKIEAPFTAIVNIRGDRLYHEHISWDQSTVLAQLGLLPEYLPFPYPVTEGSLADDKPDAKYEYRLPVAGIETASKLREKNAVQSNKMLEFCIRKCQFQ